MSVAAPAPPDPGSRRTTGEPIELDGVTKVYPGSPAPAVEDVHLRIEAGETVMLLGPSGCGKTTTMKMINRIIEPTRGTIRIGGRDVAGLPAGELRRGIGYVIQQIGLFPHMTVADNIGLVPGMLRWPKARIADRVAELLDLVGLPPEEFARRYPRQLSGGQQQRVGVARALAADPPVMLMDEPFGATDPITRTRLQEEFRRIQHRLGKTIVFVTHDFDEALTLGDRIAVLGPRSRIVQFATPQEILADPADDYVASFVGGAAGLKRLGLLGIDEVALLPAGPADTSDTPDTPVVDETASLRDALDAILVAGGDSALVRAVDGGIRGHVRLDDIRRRLAERTPRPAGLPTGAR